MIAKPEIAKWQEHAPWKEFAQVEQDLIISRALVEIFSDEFLREHLAFRGGTALHKLYLNPAPRYSEDIDLVQIKPGPIKPIMHRIGEVITFFEEDRKTQNRGHGIKALYRFTSEYEEIRMRQNWKSIAESISMCWIGQTSLIKLKVVGFKENVK